MSRFKKDQTPQRKGDPQKAQGSQARFDYRSTTNSQGPRSSTRDKSFNISQASYPDHLQGANRYFSSRPRVDEAKERLDKSKRAKSNRASHLTTASSKHSSDSLRAKRFNTSNRHKSDTRSIQGKKDAAKRSAKWQEELASASKRLSNLNPQTRSSEQRSAQIKRYKDQNTAIDPKRSHNPNSQTAQYKTRRSVQRPQQDSAQPSKRQSYSDARSNHRRAAVSLVENLKDAPKKKDSKAIRPPDPMKRMVALGVGLLLFASLAGYRLAMLQLFDSHELADLVSQKLERKIELSAGRGAILDRNGKALAVDIASNSFFIDPSQIEDPEGDSALIAELVGLSQYEVFELMSADNQFQWLARHLDDETANQILELDIKGVHLRQEPKRYHPSGEMLARSILGQVDAFNAGSSGMEELADDNLTGIAGSLVVQANTAGNRLPGGIIQHVPETPGADLVLSIDRAFQYEVERLLIDQVKAMGASGGVVMVTEPASGEILAMASVRRNNEGVVQTTSHNMATTWTYEPGSVMKAMTFAAVLDSKTATPESTREIPYALDVYDKQFTDSWIHPTETWSVHDIVTKSSNVGTILWANEMGGPALDAYLHGFGFGQTSGLGFRGESPGLMFATLHNNEVATATAAIGQGLSVTPVQLINAFNTIANDGRYQPLRLVREIVHADGRRQVPAAGGSRQVVDPEAARATAKMLASVVSEGTGTSAEIEGYEAAGKTGTARKVLDSGRYEDAAGNYRYVSSFAGFLPAENPQLSILVSIDEPTATYYASAVAAPLFAEIGTYAVRHFNIAPPAPTYLSEQERIAEEQKRREEERVAAQVAEAPPEPVVTTEPQTATETSTEHASSSDASIETSSAAHSTGTDSDS